MQYPLDKQDDGLGEGLGGLRPMPVGSGLDDARVEALDA
jgi:hypothetical protein